MSVDFLKGSEHLWTLVTPSCDESSGAVPYAEGLVDHWQACKGIVGMKSKIIKNHLVCKSDVGSTKRYEDVH